MPRQGVHGSGHLPGQLHVPVFVTKKTALFSGTLALPATTFFASCFLLRGFCSRRHDAVRQYFQLRVNRCGAARRGAARHSTAQQSNALFSRPRCTLGLGGPCAVHAVVVHVRPLSARRPGARDASARQPTSRVLAHPFLTAVRIYYRQPPRGPAPDLFAAKR